MMFDPDDTQAQDECDEMLARARRAYPDSEYLQHEWLRAVMTVRMTPRGWLLDGAVRRDVPQGVTA